MDLLAKSALLAAVLDDNFASGSFPDENAARSRDRRRLQLVQPGGIKLPANCFILVELSTSRTLV